MSNWYYHSVANNRKLTKMLIHPDDVPALYDKKTQTHTTSWEGLPIQVIGQQS